MLQSGQLTVSIFVISVQPWLSLTSRMSPSPWKGTLHIWSSCFHFCFSFAWWNRFCFCGTYLSVPLCVGFFHSAQFITMPLGLSHHIAWISIRPARSFCFSGSAGSWSQGFTCSRQVLHHWATSLGCSCFSTARDSLFLPRHDLKNKYKTNKTTES